MWMLPVRKRIGRSTTFQQVDRRRYCWASKKMCPIFYSSLCLRHKKQNYGGNWKANSMWLIRLQIRDRGFFGIVKNLSHLCFILNVRGWSGDSAEEWQNFYQWSIPTMPDRVPFKHFSKQTLQLPIEDHFQTNSESNGTTDSIYFWASST